MNQMLFYREFEMRNLFSGRSVRHGLVAASLLLPFLSACGGGGGTTDTPPKPVVITPERPALTAAYKYQFVFESLSSGQRVTDELKFSFVGPAVDDGEVLDIDGVSVKGKSFSTKAGVYSAAAAFTGTNDVFTVLVGNLPTGWNTTGVQISKDTSKSGSQTVVVQLSRVQDAAAINADASTGVAVATTTTTVSGGVIAAPVTLTSPQKTTTNVDNLSEAVGTATISIPANTVARDANGTLAAGQLSLTVTKFSNNEPDALAAFPGGFTPLVEAPAGQLGGATNSDGAFVTGGFAQFNLTDSSGKAIKNFDTPVSLSIDLPKTARKPNGSAFVAGDTYPVWSFDETSGKWKFESDGTVAEKTPVDPAFFKVSFQSTHLSYWNLDYYEASCTATLNITGRGSNARPLAVYLYGTNGFNFTRTLYGVTDASLTLLRYPVGRSVDVVVYAGGSQVGRADNQALCSGGSVAVTLPAVASAKVDVNVTESCPDGSNKRAAPTWVYFETTAEGLFSEYAAKNTAGTAATGSFPNVPSGGSARVWAWNPYSSSYFIGPQFTVASGTNTREINFPNLQCTGGGSGSGSGSGSGTGG